MKRKRDDTRATAAAAKRVQAAEVQLKIQPFGPTPEQVQALVPRLKAHFLCYRGTEIDDGVTAVGPPYEARIDTWVNGEPINGTDVVVWYGAHFTHNIAGEEPGHFGHIVGPDLKRVKW
jgi:hypothetical protein